MKNTEKTVDFTTHVLLLFWISAKFPSIWYTTWSILSEIKVFVNMGGAIFRKWQDQRASNNFWEGCKVALNWLIQGWEKSTLKASSHIFDYGILIFSLARRMKNKSHMSMLNNNGPSMEPWITPDEISCHEIYVSNILTLFLQDVRW